MTDLITELESAPEESRELDVAIARSLGRNTYGEDQEVTLADGNKTLEPIPHYTTSLDAAVTLVPEEWHWEITDIGTAWVGTHLTAQKVVKFAANAATPALALCIAALKARQADD